MPRSRYVADPRRDRADDEIAAWAQLIERRRPDVLLVDFVLPDDSETDVAQSLRRKDVTTPVLVITASPRADPATRDIPVFVLSASTETKRGEALRVAGATEYVTKPFEVDELASILRRGPG